MSDEIRAQKKALRERILAMRDEMPPGQRAKWSGFLKDHADVFGDVSGLVVSTFWPIRSEIRPFHLTNILKARGARLCLPVVMDKTTIEFRAYESDDDLIDAGFGTKGPSDAAPAVDPDIMLVPLSVFDETCARIGYGAGFYDRAIARLRAKGKNPATFGLAFDLQCVDQVPQDQFDIRLDRVLTEHRVIEAPSGE